LEENLQIKAFAWRIEREENLRFEGLENAFLGIFGSGLISVGKNSGLICFKLGNRQVNSPN
jgi:hypothetical protein